MKHDWPFQAVLTLFGVLAGAQTVSGQGLPTPSFRPTDGKERAARVLESVQTMDSDLSAVRRLFIDATTGTLAWLEFEPNALALVHSAASPGAAAMEILTAYGPQLFGTGFAPTNLELRKVHQDRSLTHLRYAQRHNGRPVYGGEVLVHVAQVKTRYAVQSMNGRIYSGIDLPADPALSYAAASQAALNWSPGGRLSETQDSTPIVIPHETAYRLAYAVNLIDPAAGPVTRYVDVLSGAPFAETPAMVSWREDSSPRPSTPTDRASDGLQPVEVAMLEYVSTTGIDALGNQRGPFNVWRYSATSFAMASNGWPGVSQIEIRDFGGTDLGADDCSGFYPYAQATSIQTGWPSGPDDPDGSEEVSAVANMGETMRYYNTKFGRQGIRNEYDVLGRPVLHPARACVHGSFRGFNAVYYRSNGTWGFVSASDTAKASAAAQDVVTHELQHGVTHIEANLGAEFENRAVNEALSDYFGLRHRGSSCLAFDALGFCLRDINSDLTVDQRQSDPNCAGSWHCVGVAFSSALWRTAHMLVSWGDDVDWGAYNGLRFYMASTVQFVTGREAIVRAAKDRIHQEFSTADDIAYDLENEFFRRGIGPEAIRVQVIRPPGCGEWYPDIIGSGARSFALHFEAGTEYWPDGSTGHRFYSVELGTFTAATLEGRRPFLSSQLGGHTLNDGHAHAFRFLFTDTGPVVTFLSYWARGNVGCGIMTQLAGDIASAEMPTKFAVRQAIQTSGGLVSSRVAGHAGAQTGAEVNRTGRGALREQVRRSGITALEVDVPAHMAEKRLEVRIFDLQGQPVRVLIHDVLPSGRKIVAWDRMTETGAPAPAGVYVVVVRYGDLTTRTRFVIPRSR